MVKATRVLPSPLPFPPTCSILPFLQPQRATFPSARGTQGTQFTLARCHKSAGTAYSQAALFLRACLATRPAGNTRIRIASPRVFPSRATRQSRRGQCVTVYDTIAVRIVRLDRSIDGSSASNNGFCSLMPTRRPRSYRQTKGKLSVDARRSIGKGVSNPTRSGSFPVYNAHCKTSVRWNPCCTWRGKERLNRHRTVSRSRKQNRQKCGVFLARPVASVVAHWRRFNLESNARNSVYVQRERERENG